jgi:hypothetical protein
LNENEITFSQTNSQIYPYLIAAVQQHNEISLVIKYQIEKIKKEEHLE